MAGKTIPTDEFYHMVGAGDCGLHPEHWPDGVNCIGQDGLTLFGIDRAGNVYMDGKRLYTEARFNWFERVLAAVVAVSGLTAAIAAGFSAVADWHQAFPG